MQLNAFIRNFLNISDTEVRPIILMLIFSFFMGLAGAFYYTAATALFIIVFPTRMLPYALIASGIIGYLIAWGYSSLQRILSFSRLLLINSSFLLLSISLLSLVYFVFQEKWIIFSLYLWIKILLFLTAIGFWGLAGKLFNLRQAKRLFGLVSSGEVVSNIIGFFSIPLLLSFIATKNLLWFAIFGLLGCLITLIIIINNFHETLNSEVGNLNDKNQTQKQGRFQGFFHDRYYLMIFLLAILPMLGISFSDYLFLGQTKLEFKNAEMVTSFLGFFLGFMAIIEFIIKTLLSGKLLTKYGIRLGLTLLPATLAGSAALAGLVGLIYGPLGMVFSFIALEKLSMRSIRSAIYEPAFQILYQPVPVDQRMLLQSKTEGAAKSSGNILAGLLLLTFSSLPFLSLLHINAIFLMIALFWFYISGRMYREYRNKLREVLKLEQEEIRPASLIKNNVALLRERITHIQPERISILLKIIEQVTPTYSDSLLIFYLKEKGLTHFPEILEWIQKKNLVILLPMIESKEIKIHEESPQINEIIDYLRELSQIPLEDLIIMSESTDAEERKRAAILLGYSGRYNAFRPFINLLLDSDSDVREAALIGASRIKRVELWPLVIENLAIPDYSNEAASVIRIIKDPIIPELDHYFNKFSKNKSFQIRVIRLWERIGGDQSIHYIRDKLAYPDKTIRAQAIHSLKNLNYKATPLEQSLIKQSLEDSIAVMVWIIASLLDIQNFSGAKTLIAALGYELDNKREQIFSILSLLYDSQTISIIRENVEQGSSDSRGYALEICDMIISQEIKDLVIPIFDDLTLKERLNKYHANFPQPKKNLVERLLDIVAKDFTEINYWTKALALNILGKVNDRKALGGLAAMVYHSDEFLSECAFISLATIDPDRAGNQLNRFPKAISDKFKMLLEHLQTPSRDYMPAFDRIVHLSQLPIFKNVPVPDLIQLGWDGQMVLLQKGFFYEYKKKWHTTFFILIEGELELYLQGKSIQKFQPYSCLGEVFFSQAKFLEGDFKALSDSRMIALPIQYFYFLMADHVSITEKILNDEDR